MDAASAASARPSLNTPTKSSGPPAPPDLDPWPRKFSFLTAAGGSTTLLVYQPQVEKWEGNRIDFRAAVSARTDGATGETFGVIWATARTEVDRVARRVTLEDLSLTRSNFPTLADNGASYLQQLQLLITGSSRTIALDRLQASLAASGTVNPTGVAVKNGPPPRASRSAARVQWIWNNEPLPVTWAASPWRAMRSRRPSRACSPRALSSPSAASSSRRIAAREVTDLPLPDSPTSATTEPRFTWKLTPRTASTRPPCMAKDTLRSSTFSNTRCS